LASEYPKSWPTVRGEKSLNDQRVATYERLMDAEELIARARGRRGESPAKIEEALAVSERDGPPEPEDDLYLGALGRFVAALGGRLEVLAVFPEETTTVRRAPDHREATDAA
jgi:hypothetical protein